MPTLFRVTALALLAALSACAAPADGPPRTLGDIVAQGDWLNARPPMPPSGLRQAAERRAAAPPLTLESAVAIALLNAPETAHLAAREAVSAEALEKALSNPKGPAEWALINRLLAARLAALPDRALAPVLAEAAPPLLKVARDARTAWFKAVAADQAAEAAQKQLSAAEAHRLLTDGQGRAGTAPADEPAHGRLIEAEAQDAAGEAQLNRLAARQTLAQNLGLTGDPQALPLPAALPPLPDALPDLPALAEKAVLARADSLLARRSLGGRAAEAQARGEVQLAAATLQERYDAAKRAQLVKRPAARLILEESQRRYNGMLVGIYDLIAALKGDIDAGRTELDARAAFYIAHADLEAALGAPVPLSPAHPEEEKRP